MNKGFVLLVVVVVATIVAFYYVFRSNETVLIPSPIPLPPSASLGQAPATATDAYSGARLAGDASPLLDFNSTDFEQAKASHKLVVLYFYANWCPICRAEFPLMEEAFNELTTDEVIGFRVNYNDSDTDAAEQALAREHGVAYQHTKVFLKSGQRILKSPESWDKARYLAEITKATAP